MFKTGKHIHRVQPKRRRIDCNARISVFSRRITVFFVRLAAIWERNVWRWLTQFSGNIQMNDASIILIMICDCLALDRVSSVLSLSLITTRFCYTFFFFSYESTGFKPQKARIIKSKREGNDAPVSRTIKEQTYTKGQVFKIKCKTTTQNNNVRLGVLIKWAYLYASPRVRVTVWTGGHLPQNKIERAIILKGMNNNNSGKLNYMQKILWP